MPQAASSTRPAEGSLDRNRSTKLWCIGSISPHLGSKSPARASSCCSSTRRRSRSQAARPAAGVAPGAASLAIPQLLLEVAPLLHLPRLRDTVFCVKAEDGPDSPLRPFVRRLEGGNSPGSARRSACRTPPEPATPPPSPGRRGPRCGRRGRRGPGRRSRTRPEPRAARPAATHPARAHSEAAYRLGSDRGSPNHGSTLLSKRVKAQIRSPVRVRTNRPVPWRMPVEARR